MENTTKYLKQTLFTKICVFFIFHHDVTHNFNFHVYFLVSIKKLKICTCYSLFASMTPISTHCRKDLCISKFKHSQTSQKCLHWRYLFKLSLSLNLYTSKIVKKKNTWKNTFLFETNARKFWTFTTVAVITLS